MPDSTINGLTATTGAAISQTADYFPIWDNAGATTKKINRSELLNGPILGSVGSALRGASSDYSGVVFDGATSGTRVYATLTNQNIGASDFTLWSRFRCSKSTTSSFSILALSDSSVAAVNANSSFISLRNGALRFSFQGATTADLNCIEVASVASNYGGQIIDVTATRSGTTVKIYINGIEQTTTTVTAGTPPAFSNSVGSAYCLVGSGIVNIFDSSIYRAVVFNRALSASDVTDLVTNGVDPADQWGTQTQVMNTTTLNGGFETAGAGGTDVFANWSEYIAGTGSTLTRDTTDYSPDLGSTASAKYSGADGTGAFALSTGAALSAGKRYRIRAAHKSSTTRNQRWVTSTNNLALVSFSLTTAWTNFEAEFVMPATDQIKCDGSGAVNTWIDNVQIDRIGAIVDLDFTVGYGYQAPGRSTNGLHGILINGVSWTNPQPRGILYATTSTNGNQQLLGTLAIPADATITAIYVNSNGGTPTVTMGNASAGTQIFGSTALTGVARQQITPTLPISTTGNLWVNSNSTATLNWTIEYVKSF